MSSNLQLYDQNNRKLQNQDDKLDIILANTREGKEHIQNIDREIDNQDGMLDDLGKGFGEVNRRMRKADSRLESLLKSQSYCCLGLIIAAELAIMILLLLL